MAYPSCFIDQLEGFQAAQSPALPLNAYLVGSDRHSDRILTWPLAKRPTVPLYEAA